MGSSVEAVCICVFDAAGVEDVLFGDDGLAETLAPGTVVLVHSTVSPAQIRQIAERAIEHDVRVLDAPVSGGAPRAIIGELTIMVGGDEDALAAVAALTSTLSNHVVHLGGVGTGSQAKLINNTLFAAQIALADDAVTAGITLGIDPEGLDAVLMTSSSSCIASGVRIRAGSLRGIAASPAGPTLAKDVELMADVLGDTPGRELVDTARRFVDRDAVTMIRTWAWGGRHVSADPSDRLGVEHQTVFGLPPVEFVHLAADVGCRHIATGLVAGPYNPHGYEPFSLRDDAGLRRRMQAAMRERDVSISLGEGFTIRPGVDAGNFASDLDTMAELGVARINTVSMDPDVARSLDQFGLLAEMAAARGLNTTVEFAPSLTIGNLDAAIAAMRHVDRPDFNLLIDTMHFVRAGHTVADLATVDPARIVHVQLCDNSVRQRGPEYRDDTNDRSAPGEGELPLAEIVAALPRHVPIGLEVPMRPSAEAGESTEERVRRCVRGAATCLEHGREAMWADRRRSTHEKRGDST